LEIRVTKKWTHGHLCAVLAAAVEAALWSVCFAVLPAGRSLSRRLVLKPAARRNDDILNAAFAGRCSLEQLDDIRCSAAAG